LEVVLPVANRDAFIGWVLGFGPDAEVLAPDELRRQVLARVEAAVQAAG
jgi:predicted DNA-binding transcriptional regulator YafY